jgi:hypothetical protein
VIKLHRALMAGALLALASVSAQAGTIVGSLSMAGFDVQQTGTGLNLVTSTATTLQATGKGDFAPVNANFSGTTVNVASLKDFTFTNSFGTFSVAANSDATIVTHTSVLLDIYFLGTFTPSGGLSSFDAGPASARVTIAFFGDTLGETVILNSPPAPLVPEPASIAMAGIGLAGLGLVRVLRKRSV